MSNPTPTPTMFVGGGAKRPPTIHAAPILQRNLELKSPAAEPPLWMAVISVASVSLSASTSVQAKISRVVVVATNCEFQLQLLIPGKRVCPKYALVTLLQLFCFTVP